jgi:hypothetical protein
MSNLPRGKTPEYWEGFYSTTASAVAKALRKDNAIKTRIFARSPGAFSGMDSMELASASSRELAERELKELGIEVGDNDPVQLLDAHHAGRKYARDYLIPGNRLTGGNRIAGNNGNRLLGGSASDSSASGSGAQAIIDIFLADR